MERDPKLGGNIKNDRAVLWGTNEHDMDKSTLRRLDWIAARVWTGLTRPGRLDTIVLRYGQMQVNNLKMACFCIHSCNLRLSTYNQLNISSNKINACSGPR
jgi:hypothetical protein